MFSELTTYVSRHREESKYYTHTSQMFPLCGRYYLERSKYEEFWRLYCDQQFNLGDDFLCGISEKPYGYMPVLADIDIKLPFNENTVYDTPLYTKNHLMNIVKIYQDALKHCVDEWQPHNLTCFVLEKTKPVRVDYRIKSGFHLHFPFLFLSQEAQEIHVEPRIKKQIESEELFRDLGIQHSGEVLDVGICKKHWLMYNCRKAMHLEPYKLTKILDFEGRPIDLKTALQGMSLYDADGKPMKIEKPLEYYLPRILSVNPTFRPDCVMRLKDDLESSISTQNINKIVEYNANNNANFENLTPAEILLYTKRYLDMLKSWRAEKYDDWINVGFTLFNCTAGCIEGLEMWKKFSQQADNYNEASCNFYWNKMEVRNKGLGTLRMWAREDNPEEYEKFTQEIQSKNIADSLDGGQTPLAKQLYAMSGEFFVCTDITKKTWYVFKNHRWYRSDQGVHLKLKIQTDIVPKFKVEAQKAYTHSDNPGDEATQRHIKRINDVLKRLNTSGFKKGIMEECQDLFYNEEFMKNLDQNPMLLGFDNGVLDLQNLCFRAGRPEDYVSMSCGYNYKEFDWNDPEVIEVQEFLLKIFPDDNLRQWFMEYCAKLLLGGNFAKTFVAMTGHGDNGKSMTIELIEHALGKYSIKFPTSLFTGKRTQSSQASPELARVNGVRFAVAQEPDTNDTLNAGIIKELTGNDSFATRGLFSDVKEIKPLFKMTLICNKLPRISSEEEAIWNRVRVLPYESRFPKNNTEVPLTFEEQLKAKVFFRDPHLGEKLRHMKEAFMWLMFQTFRQCYPTNSWMEDPSKVRDATSQYRENNDIFLQFMNECYVRDNRANVKLNDVYENFKSWAKMSLTGKETLPTKRAMQDYMVKKWGPLLPGQKWIGYRERTIEDDEAEGKLLVLRKEDLKDDDEKHSSSQLVDDDDDF